MASKKERRLASLERRLVEVTEDYHRADRWVYESYDYGYLAHSSAAHVRDVLRRRVERLVRAAQELR